MASSCSHHCRRSFADRSALSPTETTLENPSPKASARWSSAVASEPDWLRKPMGPGATRTGSGTACSRMSGAVFTTPSAPGPMRRMPQRRTWPTRSAGASDEGVSRTTPRTPFAAQASSVGNSSAGATATTARSTASGTSSMRSLAGADQAASVPTRTTGPAKSWVIRLANTARAGSPTGPSPAITATADGASRRPTERASARCSRSSMAAWAASVASRLSSTSMTPSANWRWASNPARSNTPSMRRLSGSTEAIRRSNPASRAAAIRYSRKIVARPRPRWFSSAWKATSASLPPRSWS